MRGPARYEVHQISLADIEVTERLRPATAEAVEALAEDIARRGLRTPVEIAATPKGRLPYRLVSGAHRVAACWKLDRATIAARIVTGSELELRRDEIMENLGRNELSALEMATFLAELRRVEQALTGARHGGDRRSRNAQADQRSNLDSWYDQIGRARRRAPRTIRRYVEIGERLDPDVAERLRGSAFEDQQGELEALGKYGSAIQSRIADQLLAETNAAPTVKSAVRRIEGAPDAAGEAPDEKDFRRLLDLWNRASAKTRKRFLKAIEEDGE